MIENYPNWLNSFLERRNLEVPDGRPLYAYRCSTDEFETLGMLLQSERMKINLYLTESLSSSLPTLDRLFVLFSAEWWRRNYASGPWKWQPIFAALNWPETDQATRSRFVERGLRYWKRNLLRKGDYRGFLLTIACEGGLPVNLIRNDTGYLRAFLRAILRHYATYGSSRVSAAEIAGIHLNYLPVTLQQPMVQELAGILIERIWDLQTQITQGVNPVEELDQLDSSWRQRLPLVLGDDAANALVSALLLQARKIRSGVVHRLRIVRRLVKIENAWQLHAELQLPEAIDRNSLIADLGLNSSLGERLELQMAWGEKAVRAASMVQQGDSYNVYPYDRRHLQIRENAKAEISCLVYERGQHVGPIPLPSGSGLTNELPVIFVDRETDGQSLDFCGQGSLSSRFPEVYVLTHFKPEGISAYSDSDAIELIAEGIRVLERDASLYKLSGDFSIVLDESTTCVIRTRQQDESAVDYRFEGRQNRLIETKWPVFIGVPRARRIYENGTANNVSPEELYWSKITGKRDWQKVTEISPRGLIELRHVQNGACLFTRRAIVLPEGAEIQLEPSDRKNAGMIVLRKLQCSHASWEEQEGLKIDHRVEDDCIALQCSAERATTGKIKLKLLWDNGCECELVVPFPAEGGRFVTPDGRVVQTTEYLALDDLFGYSVIAASMRANQRFYIQGKLQASDIEAETQRALDFRVSLKALQNSLSIYELPLYELYHRLLQLFSHSSDRDAIVILELMRHGVVEARTQVRQFAARIEFDKDLKKLYVEPAIEEMVAFLNHESIELFSMKDPTERPQWLQMHDNKSLSWPVPHEVLEKGPWLAVASQEVRRRYRPRLVPPLVQESLPLTTEGGLCEIISDPNYQARIQAMHDLFRQMDEDFNHLQWQVLFSYVERFAVVPPNCLDWIAVAIEHPRILIGLLLIGGSHIFEIVYTWEEHLPFKWWMLPIKDWRTVIHAQLQPFQGDTNTSRIIAGEIERTLWKIKERESAFGMMLEYLLTEILQTECPTSILKEVKAWGVDKSWKLLEGYPLMNLLREMAEAHWPTGMDRNGWSESVAPDHRFALRWLTNNHSYQRSVLDAPLAAAYFSIIGKYPQKSWRSFLTAFRDFHPDWFDTAFRAVQAILLTKLETGNNHD
ncbi:STY4851/ECs_5259 family protein [bacterium]|nr:STY4851/ECs_5259 family protein [bacterium]